MKRRFSLEEDAGDANDTNNEKRMALNPTQATLGQFWGGGMPAPMSSPTSVEHASLAPSISPMTSAPSNQMTMSGFLGIDPPSTSWQASNWTPMNSYQFCGGCQLQVPELFQCVKCYSQVCSCCSTQLHEVECLDCARYRTSI